MKLRSLKVATFKNTSLPNLQAAVNDMTSGKAVLTAASGTVDYAAGFAGEKDVVWQRLDWDGTNYVLTLFYAQG